MINEKFHPFPNVIKQIGFTSGSFEDLHGTVDFHTFVVAMFDLYECNMNGVALETQNLNIELTLAAFLN